MNLLVKKKQKKSPRQENYQIIHSNPQSPSRPGPEAAFRLRVVCVGPVGSVEGSGRHKRGCTLPGCPRPLWLRTQVWTSHTEDRRPEEVWGLHRLQSGRPFLPLRTTGLVDITQIQDCLSSLPSHVRRHPETFSLSFSLVT